MAMLQIDRRSHASHVRHRTTATKYRQLPPLATKANHSLAKRAGVSRCLV